MTFQGFSRFWALIILAAVGVAACASSASEFDSQFDASAVPDVTAPWQEANLELGPADVVRVSVFGVSDLNGEYQVDFDGNLRFPLIGEVPAVGLTPSGLANELEHRLGEKYLQNPDVTVSVVESVSERITVDGSVASPGIYEIQGDTTLLQAVALAGGPSEGANKKKVVIFRQVEGQRMAAAFSLKDIREGEAEDPRVYGNDIIVMDGTGARARYSDWLRAAPIIGLIRFF